MASYQDNTASDQKGFEARIPWSELYNTNLNRFGTVEPGELIPRGAVLRMFANIHNNNPDISFSSNDSIPEQTSAAAGYAAGLLTTDDYVDVPLDQDNDGFPDVAVGDVNAPYIRFLAGVQGKRTVYAQFNEPITMDSATNPANWLVQGEAPGSVDPTAQTNGVLLHLTNDLPSSATLVTVSANNVEDTSPNNNSRFVYFSFFPAAAGLETSVTVRFYLETASGLGINPGATSFYINGGSGPLEFGFPASTSSPMSQFTGSLYFRDVTFPPGTPQLLFYKYSGIIQGTNNYEAVRLKDYPDIARRLTLNLEGNPMVVTDYLGAAAAPFRPVGTNAGYNALYTDPQRGDAGVRERTTMLFQVDLSGRNLSGVTRVILLGSDPLRGFNLNNENPPTSDFPTAPTMSWNIGGLTMYDDGTHGDMEAGDGIYSLLWSFTTNGFDSSLVPGFPNSLVGGEEFDSPYFGVDFWQARRSPRSFAYKFAVYKSGTSEALLSPDGDIEHYIESVETNIVLSPFVWANENLPLPPPTNSPTMEDLKISNGVPFIIFTNIPGELQHGVQISTNLISPWLDFGHRAVSNGAGLWSASIADATPFEVYRAYAGPGLPLERVFWTPNPIPATGATLTVTYKQSRRLLAGQREVRWLGRINDSGFTNFIPFTFLNDGAWTVQVPIPPATSNSVQWVITDKVPSLFDKRSDGKDFYATVGGRASWTPDPVTPGNDITITYNPAGGPLAAADPIHLHHGFDGFQNVTFPAMSNDGFGVWSITINVATNYTNSVDFVFRNAAGSIFDNNNTFDWHAFIEP
jgi:hypothetical protein